MIGWESLRNAIQQTGAFDFVYQTRRFNAAKRSTAKALLTVMFLFSCFSLADFFVLSDPISILKIRLIFAPALILLFTLLMVTNSYLVFHVSSSVIFATQGIAFVMLIDDGSVIIAMHCTAVLVASLFVMMPFMRTPFAVSIIPSTLMVLFFTDASSDLAQTAWVLSGGTLASLLTALFFSETIREVGEYKAYNERRALAKEQKEQKRWAYMTGRLLRHELSNQLVGLSSSLDMLLRDKNSPKQLATSLFIPPIQRATYQLQNDINELALASEWSTLEDETKREPELLALATASFARFDINITKQDAKSTLYIKGASKNIVLYALNRVTSRLTIHVKHTALWGEIRASSRDSRTIEIVLNAIRTQPEEHVSLALAFEKIISDRQTNAAMTLLKNQGVSLRVFQRQKQLVLSLALI